MTDSFINRRADYKLWAETTNGRYEDQRNGVSPRRGDQTTMKKTKETLKPFLS